MSTSPMMPPLLLENVSISGGSEAVHVLLHEGRLDIVQGGSLPDGTRRMDASGQILLPGFFDLRAHLREPGREDSETIATGTAAAVNGGFTGLLMTPDTVPPVDNGGMVQSLVDLAGKTSPIPVSIAGCLSRGREGTELAGIGEMSERGAVMITDDPGPCCAPQLLRRALQYARDLGILIATLPDVPELSAGGAMHEGRTSYQLGLRGIHPCAEEIGLARDIRLALSCRSRLHIRHVTTARGVETIRRYKKEMEGLTAEVSPHHLLYTDESVGDYNTCFRVQPPLRPKEDVDALREGLRDGTIDIIATDHAPRTEFEKAREFSAAPCGMTWLDTAVPALYHHLVRPGILSWETLVQRMALAPRRLLGLPLPDLVAGSEVNAVLFNPGAQTLVDRAFIQSRSINTPLLGQSIQGDVSMVFLGRRLLKGRLPE